jgi:hypothetical protein
LLLEEGSADALGKPSIRRVGMVADRFGVSDGDRPAW